MVERRKYSTIPAARGGDPGSVVAALAAIKQTLDILTGVTGSGNDATITSASLPAALIPLTTAGAPGPPGENGVPGEPGEDGTWGMPGPPGTPGTVWRTGVGAPPLGLGADGDLYFDVNTGDVYLRTGRFYTAIGNLRGAMGPSGPAWLTGYGMPDPAVGVDGDFYIDITSGDVWKNVGGVYTILFNITGPTGPINTAGREVLTAARTYYVRADGADTNSGRSDASSGAFLTWQHAIDVAAALDVGIFDVTIQGGGTGGTFTTSAGLTLKSPAGAGAINLIGDLTTPSNFVLISTGAGGTAIKSTNQPGIYRIQGFKLQSTGSGVTLGIVSATAYIEYGAIEFSTGFSQQVRAQDTGVVKCIADYTISAGAGSHFAVVAAAEIKCLSRTITVTGTPAFTNSFAFANQGGVILANGSVFSGAGTGQRYSAAQNAVIFTNGGANFFPGDAAGSAITGGQYN